METYPEGEAICFEILAHVQLENHRVFRAKVNSLDPAEVRRAFASVSEPPNELLAGSVQCREEVDLRLGFAYTRFLTMLRRVRMGDILPSRVRQVRNSTEDDVESYQ